MYILFTVNYHNVPLSKVVMKYYSDYIKLGALENQAQWMQVKLLQIAEYN